MDETNGYLNMMSPGGAPGAALPDQNGTPQFGPMMQPQPQDPGIQRPAANATELEARKAGWAQVLQNPNFMRALGFMGAHLAQPIQPGQTSLGHLGASFNTGLTALQMGEYADYERKLKESKEARDTAESTASVAATEARTDTERAKLPGVQAASDVAVGTKDADIEAAVLKLKAARTAQEVNEAEAVIKKRKAAIQAEISDAKLRDAANAEVEAAALAAREARARLKLTEGKATEAAAEGGKAEITTEVLKGMDKQEQKEFLTKTGRYSTHVSSAGTTAQMYGSLYDRLKETAPNDPRVKGKTREQFQLDGMTSQKALDATTGLKNYMTAVAQVPGMDPDPEIVKAFANQIKTGAQARGGAPGEPGEAAPAADGKPVQIKTTEEYNKLPKGARYLDPTGRERIKQ